MFTQNKKFNIDKLAQSIAQYQRQGYSVSQIKKTAYKQGVSFWQFRKAIKMHQPSRIWPIIVFLFWVGVVSLTSLVFLYFAGKFLFERNTTSLSYENYDEFLTETGYRPDKILIRLNSEGSSLFSHDPNLPELFDNFEDMFLYISSEIGNPVEWNNAQILFDKKNRPVKNLAYFKVKGSDKYYMFEFYSSEDEFFEEEIREGLPGAYILGDSSRGVYSSLDFGNVLDSSKWDGFRNIFSGNLVQYKSEMDGFVFSFERDLEYLSLPEKAAAINEIKIFGNGEHKVLQADGRVFQKVFVVTSKEASQVPERKKLAPRG